MKPEPQVTRTTTTTLLAPEGQESPPPAQTDAKPRAQRQPRGRAKPAARAATPTRRNATSKPAGKARAPRTRARKARKGGVRAKAAPADAARLLSGLHASWQDAVEAHRMRVEGRFRVAEAGVRAGKRHKATDWDKVRAALKVRVKPNKGRAKDLRRIEEALDQVLARVGGD